MRSLMRMAAAVLGGVLLLPVAVMAQGAIAGTVTDASKAVLPGVTVEVASPALIEKVRSAVTDGNGQYRVVDLRPGAYEITFTLPGFSTVKRSGVELAGTFVATINAELKVGSLEETITVTGETPTVDLQSTTQQRVIDSKILNEVPTSRNHYSVGVLIPGVTVTTQDVGGAASNSQGATMSIHGSRGDDMRVTQNGLSLGTLVTGGAKSSNTYNLGAMQEIAIDTGGANAEFGPGGVRVTLIPRDGGNTFSTVQFLNFASQKMQGNNYTQELRDAGLRTPGGIDKVWSYNPGFGGPIKRDVVWFYASYNNNGTYNYVPDMFANANLNKPTAWTYVPDTTRPAKNSTRWGNYYGRATWQVTPKNKISISVDYNYQCACLGSVSATTAPEAGTRTLQPGTNIQSDWQLPLTSRVLFEAAVVHRDEPRDVGPAPEVDRSMVSVTDQFKGLTYRNRATYTIQNTLFLYYRGAVSYVTGSHAFKVGFTNGAQQLITTTLAGRPYSYRLSTATGVAIPNQITLQAVPFTTDYKVSSEGGAYIQDKWTLGRMTLGYGLRYDHIAVGFPDQTLGPTPLTPNRNISFPASDGISWNDLTPRLGLSIDLFGNGKTAVKASANKYIAGQGLSGPFGSALSPVSRLVTSTTRNWNDVNANFVPDCDLTLPGANGECAALANTNFGTSVSGNNYDPDTLTGWGKRPYDWEFSLGMQQELLPRVSLSVNYFRRLFGNFTVTDNLAVNASDFQAFSITAPTDSRLPNSGGYVVSGLYDLNPSKFGVAANNYVTFADNYGKQTQGWNGFDVAVNVRLNNGLLLQGGTSSGFSSANSCEIRAKLPETAALTPYCDVRSPWQTQFKALGAYTLPKIDVEVSGTFQSIPAGQSTTNGYIVGNYVATNAIVAPSLGRPLSGGAANATVNIVEPWSLVDETLNQFDFRIAKILRVGRTRSTFSLDFYNMLNGSTVLSRNANYGAFLQPTTILPARFAKIGYQFSF